MITKSHTLLHNSFVMPSEKPLPQGYVCKLCGGTDHAVYDCSLKKKRKELEGQSNPPSSSSSSSAIGGEKMKSSKIKFDSSSDGGEKSSADAAASTNTTVHLSGLPFDMTKQSLEDYLRKEDCDEGLLPLSHHSLKYFEDSQRCKGVAYLIYSCKGFALGAIEKLSGRAMGTKELRAAILVEKSKESSRVAGRSSDNNRGGGGGEGEKREKEKRCYRCGSTGHGPKECTNERICYKCMGTDHLAAACPKRQKTYNIRK